MQMLCVEFSSRFNCRMFLLKDVLHFRGSVFRSVAWDFQKDSILTYLPPLGLVAKLPLTLVAAELLTASEILPPLYIPLKT